MITKLTACLALITIPAAARAQDAAEIVRKAVEQYGKNEEVLRNYTYKSRNITRDLDGKGRVKATHSTLLEVMYVDGKLWRHTLEIDGKALSKSDAKKSEEAERVRMKAANNPMRRVPDAYNLTIVGQPEINGRPTWQIRAVPKKDYKGPHASVFRNVEGTLWIDQKDNAWVRFEADTSDTISFGWFVARIAKGTRIHVERVRVNDEVWAPSLVSLKGAARIALVKSINTEQESTYSDYRRYSTDSRIVGTDTP